MIRIMAFVAGIMLLFGALAYSATPQGARADLFDAKGNKVGTATLTQTPTGVFIYTEVTGLPVGPHGYHIHTVGKCEPPDFTSAGPHFNPTGVQHGFYNPQGAHLGDLANLDVAGYETKMGFLAPGLTLGEGPNSLFKPGGTALVIHAGPDDYTTDPAGNSGARIACGVIVPAR